MSTGEGIKGFFDYSVTGADKVQAMQGTLDRVEKSLGEKVPAAAARAEASTDRVARSHRLGGEQAARYITTAGMLTGGLRQMGVQNEMVARSFGTFSDLLYGAAGPGGAILVAVGAVAALTAWLVEEAKAQDKAKEATDRNTDALIRQKNAGIDPISGMAAMTLTERRGTLGTEIESLSAKIAAMKPNIDMLRDFASLEDARGYKGIFGISSTTARHKYADAIREFDGLIAKLTAMQQAKMKLDADFFGYPTTGGLADYAQKPGASGKESGWPTFFGDEQARARRMPSVGFSNVFPVGKPVEETELPGTGVDRMIREGQDAYAVMAEAAKGSADAQVTAMNYVFETHRTGYLAMSGLTQSTQKASSLFIQRALEGENVQRLKGLTVARYVVSGAAAAVIRGLGQEAEKKAAYQAAEAIASFAVGDFRGGALHTAAAAGYGALAGGAAALASHMESSAQRQFDKETTRSGQSSGYAASNRQSGLTGPSNPGVRVASAGAAVGTINYNIIVTYNGATIYGDGGTREFFYRELVPLINEGYSTGAISRN